MLLSSPKDRLKTFFKTCLMKFYFNSSLMTDLICLQSVPKLDDGVTCCQMVSYAMNLPRLAVSRVIIIIIIIIIISCLATARMWGTSLGDGEVAPNCGERAEVGL